MKRVLLNLREGDVVKADRLADGGVQSMVKYD